MRDTGFIGLIMVVFLNIRDGVSPKRAWQALAFFITLMLMPIVLVVGLALLIF